MNVLTAVQVFSPAVTATVEFMKNNNARINTNVDFSEAGPSVHFMKCIYKFFTVHDVSDRTQHMRQCNPNSMQFYSVADERLQWLQEYFVGYITRIQAESKRAKLKGLTKETTEALLFTVNSTVHCIIHLLKNGFFYVLTRRFSGDPVEALFSTVRMGGGSNDVTDARTAAYAIKRILKSGLMIPSKAANVTGDNAYCGETFPTGGNSITDTGTENDLVLPDHVLILLDKLTVPNDRVDINLETVSQALICGYLIRVIEEKVSCDCCIRNISMPKTSTPLNEIIHHQDRGGLRYPKSTFVALIKHLQEFVEAAVPYCTKSSQLTKTIRTFAHSPLSECALLNCSMPNHQQMVSHIIITKFVRPLLANIGRKETQRAFRPVCYSKPQSRKILKL